MNILRTTLITIIVTAASVAALLIPFNISSTDEQPPKATGATISLVDSLPSVQANLPSIPEQPKTTTVKTEVVEPTTPKPSPVVEESVPPAEEGIPPMDVIVEPEVVNDPVPTPTTELETAHSEEPVTDLEIESPSLDSDDSSSDVSSESSVAVSEVSPNPLPSLIDGYYEATSIDQGPSFDRATLASRINYPSLAKRQGIEGLVLLRLFISASGKVERIEVEEDPGYGLAEAAIKAFTGLQGNPAILEGKAVAVMLRYPVRFTLK